MRFTCCVVIALCSVQQVVSQQAERWRLELADGAVSVIGRERLTGRAESVRWPGGDVADLTEHGARLTFGPHARLGVDDTASFTLSLELRTSSGGFATPLMCREGGTVHYSLVLGRDPGRASFEAWSWQTDRAGSERRVDDGAWHRIEGCYDADLRVIALVVDGEVEAIVPVRRGFSGSPAPALRLGNNLDPSVDQAFDGAIRDVSLRDGVPDSVRDAIRAARRARVLEAGQAEAAVRAWNDRHRPHDAPTADAPGQPARAVHTRALVQDALGLWPAPYSGGSLAGRASPLSGAVDAAPTDFVALRPTLGLDAVEGGSLTRDGYRLTRIYWRAFERWFAGGWLYEPSGAAAPHSRAAILCPHGHWSDGARHPVVQARCITLARHGYVVLAVDSTHVYDDRVALSPLSVMIWSDLRGLELLRARDDVDPARIGCTGASGGGQQTYYLTALDAGLAAAVPAVMACHFSEILNPDGVHCACNHVPHLARVLDEPVMSAAFAPRPQLFLSVTGDWTRRFPQEGFPEIAALYQALGARERVGVLQWDKGHDYDRPMRNAMYAFFDRWLRGEGEPDGEIEPEGIAVEEIATMRGLERADVPRDEASILAEFDARLAAPRARSSDDVAPVRERLRALFGGEESDGAEPARVGDAGGEFERWAIPADADVSLPVLRFAARDVAGGGVTIVVSERGKGDVLARQRGMIDALRADGREVWLADVRYVGELDVGRGFRELHGRFYGRDEGQLAVRDLRALVRAVSGLCGPDRPVRLIALGWTGAPALLLSAIEPRVQSVVTPDLGPGWRAADRRPRLARILLHGDLPDAALASFAHRIVVGGAPDDAEWRDAEGVLGARLMRTAAPLDADGIERAVRDR